MRLSFELAPTLGTVRRSRVSRHSGKQYCKSVTERRQNERFNSPLIHPTASVSAEAVLSPGVKIGPFCLVGPRSVLLEGVHLHSHVVVTGNTTIGSHTQIFPFATIGHEPQDLKYRGEENCVLIDSYCTIREHVTIHPGTLGGGGTTRIGSRCLLMAGSHVGHDCQVGNGVILANNVLLGGHVTVGDHANIGGGAAVQQFTRLGQFCRVGGLAGVKGDVIPYGVAVGSPAIITSVNLGGMRRHMLPKELIKYAAILAREMSKVTYIQRIEHILDVLQPANPTSAVNRFRDHIKQFANEPSVRGLARVSGTR